MKFPGLTIVCAFLVAAPAMRATTLDFGTGSNPSICSAATTGIGASVACSDYGYLNQSYGDTSTVNVTYVDLINPGRTLRFWDTGYNDLVNVAWGGNSDADGASHDRIEIAPTAGQTITLNSFDLGAYSFTTRNSTISIYDLGTGQLFTHTYGIGSGNSHTGFGLTGFTSANGFAIEWQDSGYNVGIDNINYSESVVTTTPEPSSLALLGTGVLGLVGSVRRRFRS